MGSLSAHFRRGKQPPTPCEATVRLHPYILPPLGRSGVSLHAVEWSLKTALEAIEALRQAGAPDDATVVFVVHEGWFGDPGNAKIDSIRASWSEEANR